MSILLSEAILASAREELRRGGAREAREVPTNRGSDVGLYVGVASGEETSCLDDWQSGVRERSVT